VQALRRGLAIYTFVTKFAASVANQGGSGVFCLQPHPIYHEMADKLALGNKLLSFNHGNVEEG
jgi:hypothetical protein